MAYASGTGVRMVCSLITTTIIADADLEDLCEASVDPYINARLEGRGAPFTSAPTLVAWAANLLCAAVIARDKLSQREDVAGLILDWRAEAEKILDGICRGTMRLTGVSDVIGVELSDPDALMPETAIFVGDEKDWESRTEERE